ncbi:MAG: portal protein [Acidobacteria bacterium]|nr:MAG: portal protein [Acidobacteriota bacterium]
MYVIVVGGGKVGYNLTRHLLAEGREVVLIEKNRARARELQADLGEAITAGDGVRVNVMREAGANRADVVAAVTGDDETNLVVCQVAKTVFLKPRTIARVSDPRNESVFGALGVDLTVSSTRIIDAMIEKQVGADDLVIPLLTLRGGDVEIVEVRVSDESPMLGKPLRDLSLPTGSILIAVFRNEKTMIPKGETVLQKNDELIALVTSQDEAALRRMF